MITIPTTAILMGSWVGHGNHLGDRRLYGHSLVGNACDGYRLLGRDMVSKDRDAITVWYDPNMPLPEDSSERDRYVLGRLNEQQVRKDRYRGMHLTLYNIVFAGMVNRDRWPILYNKIVIKELS